MRHRLALADENLRDRAALLEAERHLLRGSNWPVNRRVTIRSSTISMRSVETVVDGAGSGTTVAALRADNTP
jgi:hypothetical protein